jgi:hypothetical protein
MELLYLYWNTESNTYRIIFQSFIPRKPASDCLLLIAVQSNPAEAIRQKKGRLMMSLPFLQV